MQSTVLGWEHAAAREFLRGRPTSIQRSLSPTARPESLVASDKSGSRKEDREDRGQLPNSETYLTTALTQTTKQTQFRRTPIKSTASKDEPRSADLAFEIRGLCTAPPTTDSTSPSGGAYRQPAPPSEPRFSPCESVRFFCGHALSVPRRDSSRRPGLAVSGGPPAGETQPGGPSRSVLMECVRRGA